MLTPRHPPNCGSGRHHTQRGLSLHDALLLLCAVGLLAFIYKTAISPATLPESRRLAFLNEQDCVLVTTAQKAGALELAKSNIYRCPKLTKNLLTESDIEVAARAANAPKK